MSVAAARTRGAAGRPETRFSTPEPPASGMTSARRLPHALRRSSGGPIATTRPIEGASARALATYQTIGCPAPSVKALLPDDGIALDQQVFEDVPHQPPHAREVLGPHRFNHAGDAGPAAYLRWVQVLVGPGGRHLNPWARQHHPGRRERRQPGHLLAAAARGP